MPVPIVLRPLQGKPNADLAETRAGSEWQVINAG
jgi:hypothetical protein